MFSRIINFLKNRSLVFKLSASILMSVLIGMFLLSIFISNYSKPLLKEQVVSSAYKALAEINHNIAQGADITEQSIVNTARILELKKHSNDEELKLLAEAGLKSIREQYGHFYEFFIYIPPQNKSDNGILYLSYVKNNKIITVKWEETGFVKDREWLNAAIKSGKIHWTEPYMSLHPDGNEILSSTVSVPFSYKGDKSFVLEGIPTRLDVFISDMVEIKKPEPKNTDVQAALMRKIMLKRGR